MRLALFLVASLAMADTTPIADESLRLAALRAVFPATQVSLAEGMRIDDSWPATAPDALGEEKVYRVSGPPTNQAERIASSHVITGKPSMTRLVRFQVFHWPDKPALLVVLQYKFQDALPPMECPSLGLLVELVNAGGGWKPRDHYLLDTMHHISLKTIRMLNLDGGSTDQLLIESDFGGAGTWGVNLLVFRLDDKLQPVFKITSQIFSAADDMFTQALDVPATIQMGGAQFCFTKTTMIEDGIAYAPVRISKLCYSSNQDLVMDESAEHEKLLAPLPKPYL